MTDEAIREQNSEHASGQKLPDKLLVVVVVVTRLQTPESRDKDTQVTGRHAGSPCSATALRHSRTHTQVSKRITARDQRRGVHWLKERPCLPACCCQIAAHGLAPPTNGKRLNAGLFQGLCQPCGVRSIVRFDRRPASCQQFSVRLTHQTFRLQLSLDSFPN